MSKPLDRLAYAVLGLVVLWLACGCSLITGPEAKHVETCQRVASVMTYRNEHTGQILRVDTTYHWKKTFYCRIP